MLAANRPYLPATPRFAILANHPPFHPIRSAPQSFSLIPALTDFGLTRLKNAYFDHSSKKVGKSDFDAKGGTHEKNQNTSSRIIMIGVLFFLVVLTVQTMQQGALHGAGIGGYDGSGGINASGVPTRNYIMTTGVPYSWIDATTGTQCSMAGSDNTYQSFTLPFPFTFITAHTPISTFAPTVTLASIRVHIINNVNFPSSSYYYMIAPYWGPI